MTGGYFASSFFVAGYFPASYFVQGFKQAVVVSSGGGVTSDMQRRIYAALLLGV